MVYQSMFQVGTMHTHVRVVLDDRLFRMMTTSSSLLYQLLIGGLFFCTDDWRPLEMLHVSKHAVDCRDRMEGKDDE